MYYLFEYIVISLVNEQPGRQLSNYFLIPSYKSAATLLTFPCYYVSHLC